MRVKRVFVYTLTSIDIRAYTYILIRVCVISMYELAYCFFFCGKVIVDFNGHCICSENWWSRLHRMSIDRLVFIPAVCFTIHCSHRRMLKKKNPKLFLAEKSNKCDRRIIETLSLKGEHFTV